MERDEKFTQLVQDVHDQPRDRGRTPFLPGPWSSVTACRPASY